MQIIDRKFLDVNTDTCHASTMVFHNDEPVFAWFGGEREGLPDSSIYIQYKGQIKSLGTEVPVAYWNPILFKVKDELFLAYKRGIFCDRWQTYILNITNLETVRSLSEDKSQIIPAGLNFAVKTKPIIDQDGLIYCGSSVETSDDWASYIETYKYDNKRFKFHSRSKPLIVPKVKFKIQNRYGRIVIRTSLGIIQPSLWLDIEGNMHAMFRSSAGLKSVYYSTLTAKNRNKGDIDKWTTPRPLIFNNPNSGIDTVSYDDRLFVVYNPSFHTRYPLVIDEVSNIDEIGDEIMIQDEVDDKMHDVLTKELSYPYMIEHGGELHLVYTYGRSKIEYVRVKI